MSSGARMLLLTMKIRKYGEILPHEIITWLKSLKSSAIRWLFINGTRKIAAHTKV